MSTSVAIVVTDGLQARVQSSLFILEIRFPPTRLADDFALTVANIPSGVLEVFRLAGMIVNFQSRESHPIGHGEEEDGQKD